MDILYHYCSTSAFHAIVANKSIWLSALSLSNDTMEGRLVAAAIRRLAEADNLEQDRIRSLVESINTLEQVGEGLGFCLSEEPDLLSQWRGYAEDASGVAIGFSRHYLEWLGGEYSKRGISTFYLDQVVYDAGLQDEQVKPTYEKAKTFIAEGAYELPSRGGLLVSKTKEEFEQEQKAYARTFQALHLTLVQLLPKLYLLKAAAFKEEREWRLISHLHSRDPGGLCRYRAVPGSVIPYKEYELLEGDTSPIVEVVLGPKHITPIHLVELFLKQSGFDDVRVRRSEASYR